MGDYIDRKKHWHGFLLAHGVYTQLDPPGMRVTAVGELDYADINDHGQIVGCYTYTLLSLPRKNIYVSQSAVPKGINYLGQIVGIYQNLHPHVAKGAWQVSGFLLRGRACTDIRVPAVTGKLTLLGGINDKGQVVGGYS